ncbi:class F sortase [Arthrobacter liuii]|uniref:Class F sortase n=1 Tax=Arthrobacter liuii TaxID=1476996 RepID=A0ABQ2AF90_9MICC|nr:class F sortase [Arthrobacter liuii]GGH90797.1 hypothetical protein GCM10007170_05420 [Arthrobacter liuii]
MTPSSSGRYGGLRAAAAAGLLLLLAGCGNATASDAGSSPPVPASQQTAGTAAEGPAAGSGIPSSPAAASPPPPNTPAPAPAAEPPVLARSQPVAMEVPSIGLRTELLSLGLRPDGSLEVPQDTGNGAPAGWYSGSPTPGERGPAVVLGHVNALGGHKGVFADLRRLAPGAEVSVARADGSTAVFVIDHGATYSKENFPTVEVYGNTAGSELRLITCDGYDPTTGLFEDNFVIYARLKA